MKKILLVDDQPNFIRMLSIKLKKLGFEVLSADNGQKGVDEALKEKPDLIVMDIMMPVMDGFTAVAQIKDNEETKDIPVIFLSAKGQESDQQKAKELGAADFIAKPFSPKELIAKIESLVG